MVTTFHMDDVVRLKKVHPCGSYEWRVVRLGADIGLLCLTCGRRVLMERSILERRLKEHRVANAAETITDLIDSKQRPSVT
jgi:hypothetical protein